MERATQCAGEPAMVRVRLKGVKKVTRKLADGWIVTYWYAWIGGPRLDGTPGSPEFIAVADRRAVPQNTLKFIITKFRTSTDYTQLSASSKRAYATYLKPIELEFGDMPLAALSDPRVRGDFLEWRDEMSNTPRKADYAWTVLARLLSFGKNRGIIAVNPCERGGRLYRADRADMIWGDDQLALLWRRRRWPPSSCLHFGPAKDRGTFCVCAGRVQTATETIEGRAAGLSAGQRRFA